MAGGTAALRNAIRGLFDEGQSKILPNFKGVSDVDEGRIGEMIANHKAVEAKRDQLGFCDLSETLQIRLRSQKLIHCFHVFDTEKEALESSYDSL